MAIPSGIQARRARVAAAAQAAGIPATPAAGTPVATVAPPTPTPAATPAPVAPPAAVAAPAPVTPPPVTPVVAAAPAPTPAAPAPTPAPTPAAPAVDPLDLAHLRQEAARAAAMAKELEELRATLAAAPAPAPAAAPAAPAQAQPDPAVAEMQRQLAEAKAQLAALQKPALTQEAWQNTEVDFTQAKALWNGFEPLIQRMVDDRAAQLVAERLREAVDPLRQDLTRDVTDVRQAIDRQRKAAFEAQVLTRMPAAKDIVPSVGFREFLAQEVPFMGVTYADVFNRHVAGQNVEGVTHILEQYRKGLTPTQDTLPVDVPSAASPSALPTTAAQQPPAMPDLKELRRKLQARQISREDFAAQLALAEQVIRSTPAAAVH